MTNKHDSTGQRRTRVKMDKVQPPAKELSKAEQQQVKGGIYKVVVNQEENSGAGLDATTMHHIISDG